MAKSIPYLMKKDYIQVTLGKEMFSLHSSHPTFLKMKKAIKDKEWNKIPKLVTVAKSLYDATEGKVEIRGGRVFYRDKEVHNSLSKRITEMLSKGKEVRHLLRFMDNLAKNPSEKARNQFYDWLANSDLPITDDGCFLAYKSVDSNYRDMHTHTIDNSPGQTIMMSRKVVDTDYDTQCATGFHLCSRHYGLYGPLVLAVKANPRRVLSAVGGKIRVTLYEVLATLGEADGFDFETKGFKQLENQLVIEVKKERKEMLKELLSKSAIKKAIRSRKLSKKGLFKYSFARLKSMYQKYNPACIEVGPEDKDFLQSARKAAGLTVGQVAKKMKVSYKVVANLEKKVDPPQPQVDSYLLAVGSLTGNNAVSYPRTLAFREKRK